MFINIQCYPPSLVQHISKRQSKFSVNLSKHVVRHQVDGIYNAIYKLIKVSRKSKYLNSVFYIPLKKTNHRLYVLEKGEPRAKCCVMSSTITDPLLWWLIIEKSVDLHGLNVVHKLVEGQNHNYRFTVVEIDNLKQFKGKKFPLLCFHQRCTLFNQKRCRKR